MCVSNMFFSAIKNNFLIKTLEKLQASSSISLNISVYFNVQILHFKTFPAALKKSPSLHSL